MTAPPKTESSRGRELSRKRSTDLSTCDSYNDSKSPASEQTPRNIKQDRPWCWQNKPVMKLITTTFAESNQAASARSVYVAMAEIASDMRAVTFIASKAQIAHRAGVSYKTVDRLLGGLEAIGVIAVSRRDTAACSGRIKAPSEYTLLSIGLSDASSIGHGGKHSSTTDNKEKNLRRNLEDDVEEGARKGDPLRVAAAPKQSSSTSADASPDQEQARIKELIAIAESAKTPEELIAKLQPHFPLNRVAREHELFLSKCEKTGRTATARGFVENWMLHARPELKPARRRAPATPRPSLADDYVPPPLSEEDQADADRFNREREERKRSVFRENGLREVA